MAERDELDLEATLRDVGARMSYPPTADLLPAVRARIESPAPRGSLLDLLRSPLQLAPAFATLALLVLATLAFQPVAGQAAEALGLRGIRLFPVPYATPVVRESDLLPPDAFPVHPADVSRVAGFEVRVPGALGEPDRVHVRRITDGQSMVFLVYGSRSGIPVAPTGASVLIVEAQGGVETQLLAKSIPPGTTVEELTVNGGRAVWIEGEPHQFFYRAPNGDILTDTVRLAGNVLLWEQDGLLMRIEAQIDREQALRIARSMR